MFACRRSALVLGALLLGSLPGCVFTDAVTTLDYQAPVVAITSPEDGALLDPYASYGPYLNVTAHDDKRLSSLTVFCNDSLYTRTSYGTISERLDVASLAARYDSVTIRAVARDEAGHEATHTVRVSFPTAPSLPGPTPVTPDSGATILRGAGESWLTLKISYQTSFAYYDWQVARDAQFTSPTEYVTAQSYPELALPLAEAGRFYWRVHGRASSGAVTRWSSVRSFDVVLGTACSPAFETFSSIDRIAPGGGSSFYALGQDGLGVSLALASGACSLFWQNALTALTSYDPLDACALPGDRLAVVGNDLSGYSYNPLLLVFEASGEVSGPYSLQTAHSVSAVRAAADGDYFCGFHQSNDYPYTKDFLIKFDAATSLVRWRVQATAADCVRLATSNADTCCIYLGQIGQQDFSLGKVTAGGRTLWTRAFNLDGTSGSEHMALCAFPDEGCAFGGSLSNARGVESVFIARLGADGAILWQSTLSAGATSNRDWTLDALALLPDGSLLGAGSLTTSESVDISLMKFSASGQLLWSRTYGSPGRADHATGLLLLGDTVVLSGYQEGSYSDRRGVALKLNFDGDVLAGD